MRADVLVLDENTPLIPADFVRGAVLASNGLYLYRRLMVGPKLGVEVLKKLGPGYDAPYMKPCLDTVNVWLSRIPREELLKVESFFRKVWELHQSEAIVFLCYSPVLGKWRTVAVPQEVGPARLDWKHPGAIPQGWYVAGSIHSHGANMGAFHSPTDNGDELGWNGIHITIGKIFDPHPEYAASVVIDGERFEFDIAALLEPVADVEFPETWMQQVTKYVAPVYQFGTFQPQAFTRLGEKSGGRHGKK